MTECAEAVSPSVCVVGAAGDTGNLGVSALLHAIVNGIAERLPNARFTVLDNGRGTRAMVLPGRHGDVSLRCRGLWVSSRLHRSESLANVELSSRVAPRMNPTARALLEADAVVDVSGGDSFSDLYGSRRARIVMAPKRLALRHRRPLILLPQTYGPFSSSASRVAARHIVANATMAWARDPDSFAAMQSLLGGAFAPDRHRAGVDVAFRLPAAPADALINDRLRTWLAAPRSVPVVGINVSGLVYFRDPAHDDGLAGSYPDAIHQLLRRLLNETGVRIVLVPHVMGEEGHESDQRASRAALERTATTQRHRVTIAPEIHDPRQAKWLISQFDWFCGTRMHATIAALSTGVPAAAIAYSMKTRGVFATCGLADEVGDARRLDERGLVDLLVGSWNRRRAVSETLRRHLPRVGAQADEQMNVVADSIRRLSAADRAPQRP